MDYDTMTKQQLVDEVKSRRESGRKVKVDLRASEADLIAALEADDKAEPAELEETSADKINLEAQARADGVREREVPDDLAEYKGKYKYLPTGEVFGLKILPDHEVRAHKTHTAKSPLKFWDGTAEEFREQFDKL